MEWINPAGPHEPHGDHIPCTPGGVVGQEQSWAVSFPLSITKNPAKTHRGDQTLTIQGVPSCQTHASPEEGASPTHQ